MPQAIHISPIDNVVVALHPIAKGTLVEVDGLAVTALGISLRATRWQ